MRARLCASLLDYFVPKSIHGGVLEETFAYLCWGQEQGGGGTLGQFSVQQLNECTHLRYRTQHFFRKGGYS